MKKLVVGLAKAAALCLVLGALGALSVSAAEAVPAPHAVYGDGLLSVTKPQGWIRTFCERQKSGLTGHPEALSYPYNSCLWNGPVIAREGEHGEGWWRYEQTAYYTDGLIRLGLALRDDDMTTNGMAGVDYTFDHATNGYLGNECLWDATNWELDPGCTLWPMAVFFRAIKAQYEADPMREKNVRIPDMLATFYLKYDAEKISYYRNLIAIEGMLWTSERLSTSDERKTQLVELAERAWSLATTKGEWNDDAVAPESCTNDVPLYTHSVTFCEQMKIPMLLAAYTGKPDYLDQATNVIRKLVRDHMLPDGCPSSAEQTRGNSVYWGHETCDVTDFTWSLGYALETTGDARYADLIERCVFNAGLGCVTKDFKSLQYFSNLNQFIATGNSDQNPHMTGSTWQQFRPTHETECCAGNVHRFMPNYVSRMWLSDRSGNPVAALYGPSEVDYGFVTIKEETDYPFGGTVRFTMSMATAREFAFTYRVPDWCAEGATVTVNGESVPAAAAGTFGTVRRTFEDGDVVELAFPMAVRFEHVDPRVYVLKIITGGGDSYRTLRVNGAPGSQGTVVSRGPLLFAYPVPTTAVEDTKVYANMAGKKSENPDFKCWDMRPSGPFNFALAQERATVVETGADGFPFDTNTVPVAIDVPVRQIDWSLIDNRVSPDMPEKVTPVADKNETIRLVPYGATCLRLGVFPVLDEGEWNGVEADPWQIGENVFAVTNGEGALLISGTGAMRDFASAADVPWDSAAVTKVVVKDGVTLGTNSLAALPGAIVVEAAESIDALKGATGEVSENPAGEISGAQFDRIEIVNGKARLGVEVWTNGTLTAFAEAKAKGEGEGWGVATNGVIEVPASAPSGYFILRSGAGDVEADTKEMKGKQQ